MEIMVEIQVALDFNNEKRKPKILVLKNDCFFVYRK